MAKDIIGSVGLNVILVITKDLEKISLNILDIGPGRPQDFFFLQN